MSLLDDFIVRAALGGVGVALAAAPLGSFVVWRRMAFFGDATAHAAILGVALSLALSLPITVGAMGVALLMALAVSGLSDRRVALDTGLGVMAHASLAVGLVAVSFVEGVRIDLSAYLFGDILAVSKADIAVIWGGGALVVAGLAWRWQSLLTATLSEDLAQASGIDPRRERLLLTVGLAVVVAVAIKVVGVLLIVAMLLIPPAAARPFSRTPEAMALIAAGIGAASALAGLWGAFVFDAPAGPAIVTAAALAFLLSTLKRV
ncbi:zinc transport system permease protein [Roseivivax lentus]|uniref:High-affinity zinc uptake system membrane protein ZnuB n=1 Tax=Roseivivax lentus TaxID=633194 RepID=A0A1N7KWB7_9RHOB|nr:metal ABC transporter permease [Roseivivax lentus]SIS65885.1 zinc transport system permease protein [Roseivivax lentus]